MRGVPMLLRGVACQPGADAMSAVAGAALSRLPLACWLPAALPDRDCATAPALTVGGAARAVAALSRSWTVRSPCRYRAVL
eukprot:1161547-Pelagomonas_calceolata.AAC.3